MIHIRSVHQVQGLGRPREPDSIFKTCFGTCTAAELTPWSPPSSTIFVTLHPSFSPHHSATKSVWLGLMQVSAVPTTQTSGVAYAPSSARLARTLFMRPRPLPILRSPDACEARTMTPATEGKSAATTEESASSTEGHGCMMRPQPSIAAAPPMLQPRATIAAPGCRRDNSSVARRKALTAATISSTLSSLLQRARTQLTQGCDAPATLGFPADHRG